MSELRLYLELTYESLNEQGDRDDVEHEEEEYRLPVLLQEVGEGVPLLDEGTPLLLVDRLHSEALHPAEEKLILRVAFYAF